MLQRVLPRALEQHQGRNIGCHVLDIGLAQSCWTSHAHKHFTVLQSCTSGVCALHGVWLRGRGLPFWEVSWLVV